MADSEHGHLHPMEETEKPLVVLVEENDEILNANWCDPEKRGKWILYYSSEVMNEKWQQAVKLYRAGELAGIQSMRYSTAVIYDTVGETDKIAMRFDCGPCDDEKAVKSYGKNLIEKMAYISNEDVVVYKKDEQSAVGTRVTGVNKYCYYRLHESLYSSTIGDSEDEKVLKLPSSLFDSEKISVRLRSIVKKYPVDFHESGMWTLVFLKRWLDTNWERAHKLYVGNELPGIVGIEVTAPGRHHLGIFKFFCGPKSDLELVKTYGRTIMNKMNYTYTRQIQFRVICDGNSTILCTLPVPEHRQARSMQSWRVLE